MTAIDRLREANRYELKLENGILITYRLPMMQELIVARLLPLSIIDGVKRRLAEATADGATDEDAIAEASDEVEASMEERLGDFEADFEARQRVVAMMICSIDGEDVQMAPADTIELPSPDFIRLVKIALRSEPPGGAEGEA